MGNQRNTRYKKRFDRQQAAMAAAAHTKKKKSGKKSGRLHQLHHDQRSHSSGYDDDGEHVGGGGDDEYDGYGGSINGPSPRSNVVRSEAEFQAIIHSLQGEGARGHCAVPPMQPSQHQPPEFINDNGLVLDSAALLAERKLNMRWSAEEIDVFYDKFVLHERHEERFAKIAYSLERLQVMPPCTKKHGDVVQFYYKNKKTPEFSKQLKRHRSLKSKLKQQAAAQAEANRASKSQAQVNSSRARARIALLAPLLPTPTPTLWLTLARVGCVRTFMGDMTTTTRCLCPLSPSHHPPSA